MATFKDGINGPFRGKVGSVIGSKWRKVNYMKSLPRLNKKKRPPSPEQALVRKKFDLLNQFFRPISSVLEIGFQQFTAGASGQNVAFSYNYDQAFIVEGNEVRLNYPALRLSHGSLANAGAERAWLDDGVVHVTWHTKTYGLGGAPDDKAYILLFNEASGYFGPTDDGVTRQSGQVALTDFDELAGPEQIHVWLFFVDAEGKRASKTVYIPVSEAPED